ncbi:MAG: DUF4292 domain-containing protein [Deltaproteobacteria bacterium]|nr:DUF4292 domain-containing protein [Deltaproteobacteria bacterium]
MQYLKTESERVTLLFFLISSFIISCGPIPKPANPYTDGGSIIRDLESKPLIESFRIAASMTHSGEHRIRGEVFIFSNPPADLRIDVMSPFGTILSVLIADKENFKLVDFRNSIVYKGESSPCNVNRFTGINLPPAELISILTGRPQIFEGASKVKWKNKGYYMLQVVKGDTEQIFTIGPQKELPVNSYVLKKNGEVLVSVKYEGYDFIDKVYFPYKILIDMPKEKTSIRLKYESDGVDIKNPLKTSDFNVTIPSGYREESLYCQ